MKRRSFVASGLLTMVSARAGAMASGSHARPPRMPAAVFVRFDSIETRLIPAGNGRYSANDIEVRVLEQELSLRLSVEAPSKGLEEIRLEWPADSPDLVLNDHWERTYGDVGWQRPSRELILPWYFLEQRAGRIAAFGVSTGPSAFAHWRYADGARHLHLDTRTGGIGVQLGKRQLHLADIVATDAQPDESGFQLLRRFTRQMCATPRMPAEPVYGINDWYFAYGNNSDDLIREHTELLAPMAEGLANRPFSVIDAGWFEPPKDVAGDCCFGRRMDLPNKRFKDMAALAGSIRKLGMRPGIWTRPLCADKTDAHSLLLPGIQGRNDPARPILDPTLPEVLARVSGYFREYRRWGFELVKIDFTTFDIFGKWGFEMLRDRQLTEPGWRMHDVTQTNAEIIRRLYSTMREAAGNTYLIGCNTISHLSAGTFELNRIGDDTSGKEWERTRKMGVNALAFRGAQHGTFYSADADCVGLTTQVSWQKNRQWMDLVARSGTPLFISAEPAAVQSEQKEAIRLAFRSASQTQPIGEPLDWTQSALPNVWRLGNTVQEYDWT